MKRAGDVISSATVTNAFDPVHFPLLLSVFARNPWEGMNRKATAILNTKTAIPLRQSLHCIGCNLSKRR